MGNLKPIGSEKLTGQDKIKRIMEIARFNEVIPSVINENATSEYSIGLADGNGYEIIKERQGYIIKRTIAESQSDYIEPMKNRKYYSSYSQALKRLNLLAKELNRLNENDEGISLYGEQKKFTLKTPKPAPVADAPEAVMPPMAPPAVPALALPPAPEDELPTGDDEEVSIDSTEETPDGEVQTDFEANLGGEEEKVTFKTIQKLTGKLTQKLRVLDNEEGMTSEDVKYVINMVISALDLATLSEEDKEDILTKFENDQEEDFASEEDFGGDDEEEVDDTDNQEEELPAESEMGEQWQAVVEPIVADLATGYVADKISDMFSEDGENDGETTEGEKSHRAIFNGIFGESKVDKLISSYFEVTKQEILENKERETKKTLKKISESRKQMNAVVKLTETIEQELAAQKFLEENTQAKIVGKTNKKNLVFENKGSQVKISPEGLIL
jgi:hypothetical protein